MTESSVVRGTSTAGGGGATTPDWDESPLPENNISSPAAASLTRTRSSSPFISMCAESEPRRVSKTKSMGLPARKSWLRSRGTVSAKRRRICPDRRVCLNTGIAAPLAST